VASMAGSATVGAEATGAADGSASLSGGATAGATASGAIDGAAAFVGTATAGATALGRIVCVKPVAGQATAGATGWGTVVGVVRLHGTGTAGATAIGAADGATELAGAATAGATATGALLHIQWCAGAGTAGATATGALWATGAAEITRIRVGPLANIVALVPTGPLTTFTPIRVGPLANIRRIDTVANQLNVGDHLAGAYLIGDGIENTAAPSAPTVTATWQLDGAASAACTVERLEALDTSTGHAYKITTPKLTAAGTGTLTLTSSGTLVGVEIERHIVH